MTSDVATPVLYDVGGELLPRPFRTGRLGHVGLYVDDRAASARFYGDLLGFRMTDHLHGGRAEPMGTFLTYNSDHHAMVLIDAEVGRSRGDAYARGVTVNQISFQVSTLREVMETNEMLIREGSPVWRVGRDVPGSNWAIYFADPDGHTCELFYGMEQVGWDRRSKPTTIFGGYASSEEPPLPQPAELDEVLAAEREGVDVATGFRWNETREARYDVGGVVLPRPFKIVNSGPVGLFVSDLEASIAFYTDRMGMAVTEEALVSGERVAFLRTGTEHHTIALAPIAVRAALGLGEHTTLAGYGLQVGSYRQLRDAADFLVAEGATLLDLPAELHTGIDYAVHLRDPDGHLVRLYHEMEQVGTLGHPLAPAQRRRVGAEWPEHLHPTAPTSPNPTYQGPLG